MDVGNSLSYVAAEEVLLVETEPGVPMLSGLLLRDSEGVLGRGEHVDLPRG